MPWTVEIVEEFDSEFHRFSEAVQDELLAQAKVVEYFGPNAGRPRVDTLKGSRYSNMKELRFEADGGVWRVAFAFDPRRHAILLVADNKAGVSERLFYKRLIRIAEERFEAHLKRLSGI